MVSAGEARARGADTETVRAGIIAGRRRRSSGVLLLLLLTAPALAAEMPGGMDATPNARAIGERAIAAQHRDDAAAETYERIEREVQMSGDSPRVVELDRTYRVVPTGTGTLRLLLRDKGVPVSPEIYRQEMQTWIRTLEEALNPNGIEVRGAFAKAAEKRKARAALVDATRDAYIPAWLGREMQDGYECDKLQLDPNPNFRPRSTAEEFLAHARATIWVDEKSGHVVRGEAEILRDISFGGGVLGKVYKGGHVLLKQQPVVPDVWLPVLYQYDLSGRKFVFGFQLHSRIEIRRYRDLGAVSAALAAARNDLAGSASFTGEP